MSSFWYPQLISSFSAYPKESEKCLSYSIFLLGFLWSVTLGHRCVLSTLFPLAYHNGSLHYSTAQDAAWVRIPKLYSNFHRYFNTLHTPLTSCGTLGFTVCKLYIFCSLQIGGSLILVKCSADFFREKLPCVEVKFPNFHKKLIWKSKKWITQYTILKVFTAFCRKDYNWLTSNS